MEEVALGGCCRRLVGKEGENEVGGWEGMGEERAELDGLGVR
jgi:hypothetical protein